MLNFQDIYRHLHARLLAYLDQFPCVLLLGARQVGKSTFLRHTLSDWHAVDLLYKHICRR